MFAPDAPVLPDVQRLRALTVAHRPTWSGAGYPPEVRAEVAAWALPLRERGIGWRALSSAVGVSRTSLRSWCAQPPGTPVPRHDSAPWLSVRIADPAPAAPVAARPVLLTPSGFRVENLGEDLLLRILRELA